MDSLDLLWGGLQDALTPENLLYARIGVLLGTLVGVLPGIGPAMALALLLPVTYGLEATPGVHHVRGHLLRRHVRRVDDFDPAQHARRVLVSDDCDRRQQDGEERPCRASPVDRSHRLVRRRHDRHPCWSCFAPALAEQAVKIGAPSYFAIILLSLVLVTSVLGISKLRGFLGLFIGLTIGLVGLDLSTGQPRLILGQVRLADGIDIVVVAVGIFAVGEALWVAAHLRRRPVEVIPVGRPFMGREDWGRSWKPWLRGTALGFPFGAVPAGGAETPTFLSYVLERRLAGKKASSARRYRRRRRAGSGQQRVRCRHVRPLLALGLPVTATASIILVAMQSYGIQPGPELLGSEADLVWTLLASLLIGNTLLLVLNLPLAPLWARLLQIPRPQLYAGILFFASLGAYSVNQSAFDLALLLVFGLVGYAIRRFGIPVLPLILGVILGPLMEAKMREALGPV